MLQSSQRQYFFQANCTAFNLPGVSVILCGCIFTNTPACIRRKHYLYQIWLFFYIYLMSIKHTVHLHFRLHVDHRPLTWHGGLYEEMEATVQPAQFIQDVPGHLSVWPATRTQQYLIKLAMNLLQRMQGLYILGHLKSRKTQAGERAGWR